MDKLIGTGKHGPRFHQLDGGRHIRNGDLVDNCGRVAATNSWSTTLQLRGVAPLETDARSRGPKKLRRLFASVDLNVEQTREIIAALQVDLERLEANDASVAHSDEQQTIAAFLTGRLGA